jgi:hypothetical protein
MGAEHIEDRGEGAILLAILTHNNGRTPMTSYMLCPCVRSSRHLQRAKRNGVQACLSTPKSGNRAAGGDGP